LTYCVNICYLRPMKRLLALSLFAILLLASCNPNEIVKKYKTTRENSKVLTASINDFTLPGWNIDFDLKFGKKDGHFSISHSAGLISSTATQKLRSAKCKGYFRDADEESYKCTISTERDLILYEGSLIQENLGAHFELIVSFFKSGETTVLVKCTDVSWHIDLDLMKN
jgi:hypothetical protein